MADERSESRTSAPSPTPPNGTNHDQLPEYSHAWRTSDITDRIGGEWFRGASGVVITGGTFRIQDTSSIVTLPLGQDAGDGDDLYAHQDVSGGGENIRREHPQPAWDRGNPNSIPSLLDTLLRQAAEVRLNSAYTTNPHSENQQPDTAPEYTYRANEGHVLFYDEEIVNDSTSGTHREVRGEQIE